MGSVMTLFLLKWDVLRGYRLKPNLLGVVADFGCRYAASLFIDDIINA